MENGKVISNGKVTSLKWSMENGKVINQFEVINGEW